MNIIYKDSIADKIEVAITSAIKLKKSIKFIEFSELEWETVRHELGAIQGLGLEKIISDENDHIHYGYLYKGIIVRRCKNES